ncbi:cation:proton antiporter [Candidatus Micrarchaeota archaeon]|nr:cation:proton antiporter [Candidatus Micrarchaeota archaeon]
MAAELIGIEFQMSLLLFVSLLGYVIATRFGQSIVIGEILVGLLIGPSFLGVITYTEFIRVLAQFGAIFLLFVVGLECKFKEIYTLKSFAIASFGVVVPWVGGFMLAGFLGYPLATSIFIGTALTATSIAITANVLKELGKLETDVAKAVIGAAVIDDILGLLALSLTTEFVAHEISLISVLTKAGIAVGFLVVGAFAGMVLSYLLSLSNYWAEKKGVPQTTFIFAITLAFFYSFVAELVGLSAIVGAFIAGVALESVKIKSYREGAMYFEIVFSAIFFVSLGILINLKEITGGFSFLIFLILLVIVAVLTKLVGCWAGARLFGMSSKDSLIVGVGMTPRGEVAMIVALIGLSAGYVKQDAYSGVILMSLLTTLLTPPLLKILLKNKP